MPASNPKVPSTGPGSDAWLAGVPRDETKEAILDFFMETAADCLRLEEWCDKGAVVDWFKRLPPALQARVAQDRPSAVHWALDAAYVDRLATSPSSIVPLELSGLEKLRLKVSCWLDECDLDSALKQRLIIRERPWAPARLDELAREAASHDAATTEPASPTDSLASEPSESVATTGSSPSSSSGDDYFVTVESVAVAEVV